MTHDDPLTPELRARHLLLLVPFLWQVGGVPWANAVPWRPLSLPFLMVWQMAGVLIAAAAIGLVYRIDRRQAGE